MSKPEILEKTPTNMAELKHQLQAIEKRDGELSFRGARTIEYLNEYVHLKKKDVDELVKKLNALGIARLKEEQIHKIVDVLPKSVDEIKIILQGYTLSITKADMDKVMGVVKDYLPKK